MPGKNKTHGFFRIGNLKKIGSTLAVLLLLLMGLTSVILIAPRLFGIKVFAVATGSMEPVYRVGSLVFSQEAPPEEIRAGDCITYRLGTETITHRVVAVDSEKKEFITQGDRNELQDPPVAFADLIGKTSNFSMPLLGYLVLWIHQIQFAQIAAVFGVLLLAAGGRGLYLALKRRKKHEAAY